LAWQSPFSAMCSPSISALARKCPTMSSACLALEADHSGAQRVLEARQRLFVSLRHGRQRREQRSAEKAAESEIAKPGKHDQSPCLGPAGLSSLRQAWATEELSQSVRRNRARARRRRAHRAITGATNTSSG
jgi:hypothetical protein